MSESEPLLPPEFQAPKPPPENGGPPPVVNDLLFMQLASGMPRPPVMPLDNTIRVGRWLDVNAVDDKGESFATRRLEVYINTPVGCFAIFLSEPQTAYLGQMFIARAAAAQGKTSAGLLLANQETVAELTREERRALAKELKRGS